MIRLNWIPYKKRLLRFWRRRLPDRDQLLERFYRIGLSLQDHTLDPLELVGACSLMMEKRTIYEVNRSISQLMNESTEDLFDDEFFALLEKTSAEMELSGMRKRARQLRKFGQGLASAHGNSFWQTKWLREADKKTVSAIKDEPFLPHQG